MACHCAGCHITFAGLSSFDAHFSDSGDSGDSGDHRNPEKVRRLYLRDGRWCLKGSPEEAMLDKAATARAGKREG